MDNIPGQNVGKTDNCKIFIGNLSYDTTIETLADLVIQNGGEMVDSYKPAGKGFAFVTLKTPEQAQALVEALNGVEVDGRAISVSIARPKEDKPRRTFNGGGGFNRDRGGFGGGSRGGFGGDRGGDRGGFGNRDRRDSGKRW